MFSAADILEALAQRRRLKSIRPTPPGELPPGWKSWLEAMVATPRAVTGASPDDVISGLVSRELAQPPQRTGNLTRWQAFATLWRQEWHAPMREERGVRIVAAIVSGVMHLFFAVMLLFLAFVRLPPPAASSEGEQVVQRLDRVAASDRVVRIAADIGRSKTDLASSVGEAAPLAAAQGLDFLDLVTDAGAIISSAHTPARFGYRHPWLAPGAAAMPESEDAHLQRVELANDVALGVVATRSVIAGDRRLVLVGGRRLDERFVKALVLPPGMRVMLYRDVEAEIAPRQLVDATGVVADSRRLVPLVARVRQTRNEVHDQIVSPDGAESVSAIPLPGRDGAVLGVLLVGSSGRELAGLVSRIRWSGLLFGAIGLVVGCGLSYVVAARVTRPVEELADAARAVADGRWDVQVAAGEASGEVGALARAFTTMTGQLAEQRDRLVLAERVAAWRELARRLAH